MFCEHKQQLPGKLQLKHVIIFVIRWTMAFCFMCPAAGTGTDGSSSVLQETGVRSQVGYYSGATLEGAVHYGLCQTYSPSGVRVIS